jgi:hypothetical protein
MICGCIRPCSSPVTNPYPSSYIVVTSLLVIAFVTWRRIRPPPHPLLRVYTGVGATLVVASSSLQSCVGLTDTAEPDCRFILEASILVIASLCAEIALWWRARPMLVPHAIARRRITDRPVDQPAA